MTGGEIAAIIAAVVGFLGWLSNARLNAKKADLEALEGCINTLRLQVADQQNQIHNLQVENNLLHDADNALREENRILRGRVESQALEISTLRNENAILRVEVESYRKPKPKKDTGGL
jgi:hypothetical protein